RRGTQTGSRQGREAPKGHRDPRRRRREGDATRRGRQEGGAPAAATAGCPQVAIHAARLKVRYWGAGPTTCTPPANGRTLTLFQPMIDTASVALPRSAWLGTRTGS